MGNIRVKDVFSECNYSHSGYSLSASEVNGIIDEWIPRKKDNTRVFDANSKPAKFSGGEQRLLSVLSVIATRSDANLLIVDEPLNNLDFANARNISNMINKVIKENSEMAVIMVSHCRIFPFITKEIELGKNFAREVQSNIVCYNCFGQPDEKGFYK